MAKYRKKPIVVEAIQLTHESYEEVLNWTGGIPIHEDGDPIAEVVTIHGDIAIVRLKDYLIKGVNGEADLYPCKPDIFEQTYELVED